MTKHPHTASATALAAVLAALALAVFASACAGGGWVPDDKFAWRTEGGALTDYGGADGDDAEARNLMRLLLVGRQWDITPVTSNTVETGAAESYRAGADASFLDATGAQTQLGDAMSVEIDITSTDADITGAHLSAVYSKNAAEAAIADPGESFDVTWTFSFEDNGTPYELTAQQTLIGINFILD